MNYCPRCGTALPAGAGFCPRCGAPVAVQREGGVPTGPVAPYMAVPPKKSWVPWTAGALALLLLIGGIALFARPSSLETTGSSPQPILQKTGGLPASNRMPDDVRDWLKHLERIERKKEDIAIKQMAGMMIFEQMLSGLGPGISGTLADPEATTEKGPNDVAKQKFEDLRPDWNALLDDFKSKPPPEECKPLADKYFSALNEIPGMVGDIMEVMQQVEKNPQNALESAMKLQNKSYRDIDQNFMEADATLGEIFSKYQEARWFHIKADSGGGGLFAQPGVAMPGR